MLILIFYTKKLSIGFRPNGNLVTGEFCGKELFVWIS